MKFILIVFAALAFALCLFVVCQMGSQNPAAIGPCLGMICLAGVIVVLYILG